jgi:hypothetical protein
LVRHEIRKILDVFRKYQGLLKELRLNSGFNSFERSNFCPAFLDGCGQTYSVKDDQYLSFADTIAFPNINSLDHATVGALDNLQSARRNNLTYGTTDLIDFGDAGPTKKACQSEGSQENHLARRPDVQSVKHGLIP